MTHPKFDKSERGQSYIVAFGSYTDGEIVLKGCSGDVAHSIHHRPLLFDTSTTEHFFKEFKGRRLVMTFYTLRPPPKFPMLRSLNDYEAVFHDGQWVIAWYRQGEPTAYISKKNGLPMPTNKKKLKMAKPVAPYNPRFTAVQNLLLAAQKAGMLKDIDIDEAVEEILEE